MEEVWRAEETSPARIEAALREMIWRRADEDHAPGPLPVLARVLNLVVIVDADRRGEIERRLRSAGHLHPSRLVVCAVQDGAQRLVARGGVGVEAARHLPGRVAIAYERVEVNVDPSHLSVIDTIVDLLLVPGLPTMVWSPDGHAEGVDALRRLTQILLLDSQDGHDTAWTLTRTADLIQDTYVVDLAWLRSTPWRERVAGLFRSSDTRPQLEEITRVVIRHRADSLAAALLLGGWLCSRLRWKPSPLAEAAGQWSGYAQTGGRQVGIRLQTVEMEPPGLGGVTIELASGATVSLDRAVGGLRSTRRTTDGGERVGKLLGASRGEAGILGEGVRQALLRDPTYAPALRCAQRMLRPPSTSHRALA